jgi:hypothetical protein
MTIACLRLFTLPPFPSLPLFAVPLLYFRRAPLNTVHLASHFLAAKYFRFPPNKGTRKGHPAAPAVLSAAVREPDRDAHVEMLLQNRARSSRVPLH